MQSNPIARWHICQGSVNSITFSADGTYLATVGRDGFLTTQRSNLFVAERVIMELYYVVLGAWMGNTF
ncbi:hypothetical protein LINGRAHAP2_LOCUS18051 [Linum grandiflorum]